MGISNDLKKKKKVIDNLKFSNQRSLLNFNKVLKPYFYNLISVKSQDSSQDILKDKLLE